MCGIAGLASSKREAIDETRLFAMAHALAHRGPDDEGIWIRDDVGLAHRRLSILDLSAQGHQPMCADDGTSTIVFNGEIYNFRDLRAELGAKTTFRSTSDTEVLLRAYQRWGIACLDRLNGMFAFAIYDSAKRQLFIARDRFGIKPLFYAETDTAFLFASEVKSLLAGGLPREMNRLGVIDFIMAGEPHAGHDFIRGVRKLPMGSYLLYDLDRKSLTEKIYYRPHPDLTYRETLGADEESWIAEAEQLLDSSVKMQLVSDVPVGTYCSGGVDSSLLTAFAARHRPDIEAFNVSFPDTPGDDEGPFAKAVARHLGIRLNTFAMSRESFLKAFVQSVNITEYPLTYLNTVPIYLVSQMARDRGIPVLLSGEGADETFGGYTHFFRANALHRLARTQGALPYWAFRKGLSLYNRLNRKLGIAPLRDENDAGTGFHDLLLGTTRRKRFLEDGHAIYDAIYEDELDRNLAAELMTELQTYLPPILHRTDRASMSASVEARVPFLDHRMVEFALAVPPYFKCRTRRFPPKVEGKSLLKKLAARYIPKDVIYRPKCGFGIPFSHYELDWPEDWLHDGFITRTFGVGRDTLHWWIASNANQSAARALALEVWGQLFIWERPVADVQDEITRRI